ncbi:hypothetical protein KM043_009911 [Ampulex compressa]|nr:hypothetical protein KM043_009911 [Ampulex compressa]
MTEEETETECTLREMNCELNQLSMPDGSAMLMQGTTTVIAGVYGPVEGKPQRMMHDKASVEVYYSPIKGPPKVNDRMTEFYIKQSCEAALIVTFHPSTAICINVQEVEDSGGLLACTINAACLALINCGLSMKFTIAAVNCMIEEKTDNIILDPDGVKLQDARATFTVAFDSVKTDIVCCHTSGRFTDLEFLEIHRQRLRGERPRRAAALEGRKDRLAQFKINSRPVMVSSERAQPPTHGGPKKWACTCRSRSSPLAFGFSGPKEERISVGRATPDRQSRPVLTFDVYPLCPGDPFSPSFWLSGAQGLGGHLWTSIKYRNEPSKSASNGSDQILGPGWGQERRSTRKGVGEKERGTEPGNRFEGTTPRLDRHRSVPEALPDAANPASLARGLATSDWLARIYEPLPRYVSRPRSRDEEDPRARAAIKDPDVSMARLLTPRAGVWDLSMDFWPRGIRRGEFVCECGDEGAGCKGAWNDSRPAVLWRIRDDVDEISGANYMNGEDEIVISGVRIGAPWKDEDAGPPRKMTDSHHVSPSPNCQPLFENPQHTSRYTLGLLPIRADAHDTRRLRASDTRDAVLGCIIADTSSPIAGTSWA